MPGVSMNTISPSAERCTPTMRFRVVCGLSETMASFCTDEAVEQRRLAGVGPADEGDESAFHAMASIYWRLVNGTADSTAGTCAPG